MEKYSLISYSSICNVLRKFMLVTQITPDYLLGAEFTVNSKNEYVHIIDACCN